MIKLMDRQMIYGYFKSYFVCLASLVSLWVVVDLFTNLDDFTHHHKTFVGVLQHIGSYYGFRLTQDLRPAVRADRAAGRHVHGRLDAALQRAISAAVGRRLDEAHRAAGAALRARSC